MNPGVLYPQVLTDPNQTPNRPEKCSRCGSNTFTIVKGWPGEYFFIVFRNCHYSSRATLPLHGNMKPQPKSPGASGGRGRGTLAEASIFEATPLRYAHPRQ